MSWFEDKVFKYEPNYVTETPAAVIKYGRLEDLLDEEVEIEIDLDVNKSKEIDNGSSRTLNKCT